MACMRYRGERYRLVLCGLLRTTCTAAKKIISKDMIKATTLPTWAYGVKPVMPCTLTGNTPA